MANYLKRYKAGEHQEIWKELLSLGDLIRQPPLYSEASAVALETMSRVRQNVEILIPRLEQLGFEFGVYPDGVLIPYYQGTHVLPPENIIEQINRLEKIIGTIPLSLRAFWETVGSVDFISYHLERGSDDLDPLVVSSIDGVLDEYEQWQEDRDENDEPSFFTLSIAPDALHKDNVSGGLPYQMAVPNTAIDGIFLNEPNETTFVEYLRICFSRGGFPGDGELPVPIEELIKDLLLF